MSGRLLLLLTVYPLPANGSVVLFRYKKSDESLHSILCSMRSSLATYLSGDLKECAIAITVQKEWGVGMLQRVSLSSERSEGKDSMF